MYKKVVKLLKKVAKTSDKAYLKDYTTFKIGGLAVVTKPKDIEQLLRVLDLLQKHNIKYIVLGNGSNMLFDSRGYSGVIIKLSGLTSIEVHGTKVIAEAGANLSSVIKLAVDKGLQGLEDGFLIPATVGGATKMNAGAYNFKMSDVVHSVLLIRDNKITLLKGCECEFGYRSSGIKDSDIILRVQFNLSKGSKIALKNRLNEIVKLRANRPLKPSAGSVFKNAEGYFAGQLIDSLGLKGLKCGDAMVSHEHANVIVNMGSATSDDVKGLIKKISLKVKENYNIDLQTEINLIEYT